MRVIDLAVFLFVVTAWLFATGGELDADEPKISSSVIDAQVFAVLPFTVTLTYLASVAGIVYFSEFTCSTTTIATKLIGKCSSISGCCI